MIPFAIGATTTGSPAVSARRVSAAPAPARIAAIPASAIGRLARFRRAAGSPSAPSAVNTCTLPAKAASGGRRMSESVASAPTTSAGVVMWTGPGRSATAIRNALRMTRDTVSGRTVVVHLVIGENSLLWSSTWWVTTSARRESIWPEIAIIGTRSRNAPATALTRFDDPGPSVDMHTPGRPVMKP